MRSPEALEDMGLSELGVTAILSILFDVALIYFLLFRILLIIKGTRAVPMLVGIMVIGILYGISQQILLDLPTFNWLLEQFIGSILIIAVVLFQGDIRRALAAFGRTQLLGPSRSASDAQVVDELVKACGSLANQKIGALIVIERDAHLDRYAEEGTRIEAKLSKELLYSLFVPERQNPLHDGAVIIQNGRLSTAGVFLPMSVNTSIDRTLGTRHRAALGLSEETDALVLVVSEERGMVSLAMDGVLDMDVSLNELRERLSDLLLRSSGGGFFSFTSGRSAADSSGSEPVSESEQNAETGPAR